MSTRHHNIMKCVRIATFVVLGAWLCLCLWGWFIAGNASCGFLYRGIGFCTWGLGLCIPPLLLMTPEANKEVAPSLSSPLPFYKLIPLLLHCGLLLYLATDVPSNKSGGGDIIAVAGIFAAIVINAGSFALAMILYSARKMYLSRRKK